MSEFNIILHDYFYMKYEETKTEENIQQFTYFQEKLFNFSV